MKFIHGDVSNDLGIHDKGIVPYKWTSKHLSIYRSLSHTHTYKNFGDNLNSNHQGGSFFSYSMRGRESNEDLNSQLSAFNPIFNN
jgi:hypothetical protein